jgi:toxin YoeB
MNKLFTPEAWDDYTYWVEQSERKILKKIGDLIRDIERGGSAGIGKPEPLKGDLDGWWSRHITLEHRLVYRIDGDNLLIARCKDHY